MFKLFQALRSAFVKSGENDYNDIIVRYPSAILLSDATRLETNTELGEEWSRSHGIFRVAAIFVRRRLFGHGTVGGSCLSPSWGGFDSVDECLGGAIAFVKRATTCFLYISSHLGLRELCTMYR